VARRWADRESRGLAPIKPIIKRIQKPEQRLLPPPPEPPGPPLHEKLREGLAQAGFFQGDTECHLETFARYFGISYRELREQLRRRAAGLPAELHIDTGG